MNKQELIKHFEEMEYVSIHQMGKKSFIDLIEKLDEPQKPVVPQFVADWIEYCKITHVDLQHALIVGDVYFYNYANQKDFSKLKEFLETENNQETFVRAWLDGYEVEKEKLVKVRLKGTGQYLCNDETGLHFQHGFKTDFTKEYLEQANFGWVFDCPGIEIEEAE